MKTLELAAENILPRVLLVQLYDTVTMQHMVRKRISDSYELSIYLEGSGDVMIQNTTYAITPGSVRFTTPGTALSSTPDYRCITAFFDFGSENTVLRNPILDGIPSFFSEDLQLLPHFENLLQAHLSPHPTAPLQQNAALLTLLAELYNKTHTHRKLCSAVRICTDYMQKHFSDNISLEGLGALTGYSPLHLLRLFKQDLGQTPHQYLTAIRLETAKKLLSETDMRLDQISISCGFHSTSHFKSLFKQTIHCTPGVYRKNAQHL